jgi:hypothetical protein
MLGRLERWLKSPDEAQIASQEVKGARKSLDSIVRKDLGGRALKLLLVPGVVGGLTLAAVGGTDLGYLTDGFDWETIKNDWPSTWDYIKTAAGHGMGTALITGPAVSAVWAAIPDVRKINTGDGQEETSFDLYMDGAVWVGAAALGGLGMHLLGYDAAMTSFFMDTIPAATPELYLDDIPLVGSVLPHADALAPVDWVSEHIGNLFSVFKASIAAPMTAYVAHYGIRFAQHGLKIGKAIKSSLSSLPAAVVGGLLLAPSMIAAFAGYDVFTDGAFLTGAAATYGLSFLASGSAGSATRMMSTILASYGAAGLYHDAWNPELPGVLQDIADYAVTGATFFLPAAQMGLEAAYGHFRIKHESPEYTARETAEVAFAGQGKRRQHYGKDQIAAIRGVHEQRRAAATPGHH